MFSNRILGNWNPPKLLTWPLVLETADAEEASSFLATPAVPYRSELLASGRTFSTQVFCTQSPCMYLSRVRTTGAMRVKAQLPQDSYAIVFGIAGEVEHSIAGEHVTVSSKTGLVQSMMIFRVAEVRLMSVCIFGSRPEETSSTAVHCQ